MKFLHIVWRNLMRRKIRTFFTVLSILVAFVLFGVLMAIRAAFSMGVEVAGADRLMVIHKVSLIQPLPQSYGDRIRATEGVDGAHARQLVRRLLPGDPGTFVQSMAVEPESWLRMYPEFELPEDQKKAWLARPRRRRRRRRPGEALRLEGRRPHSAHLADLSASRNGGPWEFTIDGIYDSAKKGVDKTQFFFHYDYLNEAFRGTGRHGRPGRLVRHPGRRSGDVGSARQAASTRMFANSPAETKTATEKAFVADFAKQIGDIGSIMMAIAGVVMFFILLVAGNTMAQSVRERTNELGVLKTLGFGDGRILSLVLLESCTIAVVGGGAGLAAVVDGRSRSSAIPTGGLLPIFHFPPRDLILGAALVAAARRRAPACCRRSRRAA